MALENEIKTYQRELPNLLQQEGQYVLIHGDEVAGVYSSYEDAIKVGYEKFKLDPFLVKRIQAIEEIQFFTRDLAPCPI